MYKIMISHNSKDKFLVKIIKDIILNIAPNTIKVWYSSDSEDEGGLDIGNWYNQVIEKLNNADLLIVLLTQNSINSNWVLFETGYMSHKANNSVVPLCIGVNLDTIKSPMSYFQMYDILKEDKMNEFLGKLLLRIEMYYDKEQFSNFVKCKTEELIKLVNDSNTKTNNLLEFSEFEQLKILIENQFNDLHFVNQQHSNLQSVDYSVEICYTKDHKPLKHYIQIANNTTVSNVLDEVYCKFLLTPFTYLEKWILINSVTKKKLVIREISQLVFAKEIF